MDDTVIGSLKIYNRVGANPMIASRGEITWGVYSPCDNEKLSSPTSHLSALLIPLRQDGLRRSSNSFAIAARSRLRWKFISIACLSPSSAYGTSIANYEANRLSGEMLA